MEIVVNHLTRMRPGFICIAGLDVHDRVHVRPVVSGQQLKRSLIESAGGPVDIGVQLDLGNVKPAGERPEVEDTPVDFANVRRVREWRPAEFWALLEKTSRSSLIDIFGKDLTRRSRGATLDIGKGKASLGNLRPTSPPELYIREPDKLRASLKEGDYELDLSVTDLRFYEADQRTLRTRLIDNVSRRIEKGVGTILSVGLARPFQASGDDARRHWLQINNIHLEDRPVKKPPSAA